MHAFGSFLYSIEAGITPPGQMKSQRPVGRHVWASNGLEQEWGIQKFKWWGEDLRETNHPERPGEALSSFKPQGSEYKYHAHLKYPLLSQTTHCTTYFIVKRTICFALTRALKQFLLVDLTLWSTKGKSPALHACQLCWFLLPHPAELIHQMFIWAVWSFNHICTPPWWNPVAHDWLLILLAHSNVLPGVTKPPQGQSYHLLYQNSQLKHSCELSITL